MSAVMDVETQLARAENMLAQAEQDPALLAALMSDPLEVARQAGLDVSLLVRHFLDLAQATDQEVLDVLHARLRRVRSGLSCGIWKKGS